MTGHGSKFGRKKEEAIAITASTLLRWMQIPKFQTAYREARRAAFGQSIARLQQASTAAVSTLLKIMVRSECAGLRSRARRGQRP